MKIKSKILLISSAITATTVGAAIAYTSSIFLSNERKDNEKLIFLPKNPIEVDQSIIFDDGLIKHFKNEYFNFVYMQISPQKLEFYNSKYKMNKQIDDAINESFNFIVSSEKFMNLSKINDLSLIKEKFVLLYEKNIPNFVKVFSKNINWDYDFVSLLVNNKISDQLFMKINNSFIDLFSESFYEKKYLTSLDLYKNNEKFKLVLEKTKTTSKEIEQLAKNFAKRQVEDIKQDYSLYQNVLVKKNALNVEMIYENYELKDWNFFKNFNSKENEIFDLVFKILTSKKNKVLMNNIINKYIDSDEKCKFSYMLFSFFCELDKEEQNKIFLLVDTALKLINNKELTTLYNYSIKPLLKNNEISIDKKWKFIYPIISNLNNKYDFENSFLKEFFFYIYMMTSLEINNTNDINRIIHILKSNYVSNALEKGMPLIKEIINLSKENNIKNVALIYSKCLELLHVISGRKYHSTKAIIAGIYKLNLKELIEKSSNVINTLEDSYKKFNKDFTKIESLFRTSKDVVDSIYIASDVLWGTTSLSCLTTLNPTLFALTDFIATVILGPEIANNPWENLGNSFVLSIMNVVNIITSPLQGVNELIIFCDENNISFWEWAKAHMSCIKEHPWTIFDPMNWFHSCIKQLVKGL